MERLKVYIAFHIKEQAAGGGNQFLMALRNYLKSIRIYEQDVSKADVILFNSHHYIDELAKIRLSYPEKCFIHRIDGPMRLYNRSSDKRDNVVFAANRYLADATVFQSCWSQQQNHLLGLRQNLFETVIPNAPEPAIFNRQGRIDFSDNRKIRLIATSWSSNWNKGFDTYQWLDENLDFSRYEMVFVGNSPIEFRNIKHIRLLNSEYLAGQLKENDIFIFASRIEACSNSLLEALHCGLPVVGIDASSNPELIGKGGETFTTSAQIPDLLEKIANNYRQYQANINNPSIDEVGGRYYDFITEVYRQLKPYERKARSFGRIGYFRIQAAILYWKLCERIVPNL